MKNGIRIDTGIIRYGRSYRFTVALGTDRNGRQIRRTMSFHAPDSATERKADEMARIAYLEFKNTQKKACTDLSFGSGMSFSALCSEYMRIYAPNRLKPSTIETYQTAIDKYLCDAFGSRCIDGITTADITDYLNSAVYKPSRRIKNSYNRSSKVCGSGRIFIDEGADEHASYNTGLISSSKAHMLYYVLKSVMKYAVSQHYIMHNPCRDVILPEHRGGVDERKKFLEDNEFKKFLELFDGYSRVNTAVKLLLFTGLRSGELLALKWSDINFKKHTVSISRNLAKCSDGYRFTTPKSSSGNRIIFMNKTVEALLHEHKCEQKAWLNAEGITPVDKDLVFVNYSGGYLSRQSLNREFHAATKGTAFASMSLHCLRHCNATLLLNTGLDLKIVSEHLGHSQISTTANIYVNVTAESRRKIAAVLERKLNAHQKK